MLAQLRSLAKSPIFIALLGLLVASFLLWGIRDVFRYVGAGGGNAVIQAGARTISPSRFQQIFQSELKSYTQQTGQTISPQDAVKANLDHQVVDAVASDEALAELLRRMSVRPSDMLVVDEIRKAPSFFNPVSGMFDKQAYERFVQQQLGMTDTQFEAVLRDEIAQGQFVSGLSAAVRAPRIYDALVAASEGQGRTFGYFVLPTTEVPPPVQPTDAQLSDFIRQNGDRMKRPEMRVLTLVRFATDARSATAPVAEADVAKRFAFEKDALSTAEKRTVIQIPVRSAADAARVADALKRGQAPDAVAASVGAQPIVYTNQPKTAIADQKIADKAFTLAAGETSGPVQGDLGLAVLRVVAVSLGHVETLEEARPKIEAELRANAARTKVDQAVRKYEDARSGGANLVQAAAQAGETLTTLGPITAQGRTSQGQPAPVGPKLLQTAFALPPGGDSDIVDVAPGEYAAIRVDKILPPAVPALNDIRPELTRFWIVRDVETRLQAKANALADDIRKGKSLEAVAGAVGAQPSNGVNIQRTGASATFSAQLLGQLFQAKPGEVVIGPDVKSGPVVVARLQAIVPAAGPSAAQLAADQQPNMSRSLTQDIGQAARLAARNAIRPKVDYRRARAAVGGDVSAPQ